MVRLIVALLVGFSLFCNAQKPVWDVQDNPRFSIGTGDAAYSVGGSTGYEHLVYDAADRDSITSKNFIMKDDNLGNITTIVIVDSTAAGGIKQVSRLITVDPITTAEKTHTITWFDLAADTSIGDTITSVYHGLPLYFTTNNILNNWANRAYKKFRFQQVMINAQEGTVKQSVEVR